MLFHVRKRFESYVLFVLRLIDISFQKNFIYISVLKPRAKKLGFGLGT